MNRQSLSKMGWGRGAVLLAAILTAGLGFCLFDVHDDDHVMSTDLCAGLLAVTLPGTVFAGLLLAGPTLLGSVAVLVAVPTPVLDPPPKSSVR